MPGQQQIPPELMQMMQGGGASAGNNPPQSSPMSNPQEEEGKKQGAKAQVHMAIALLEQTLASFGSMGDEGKAVRRALDALGDEFGSEREKGRELIPSEIMNLVSSLPQGAGGGQQPGQMPPGGGAPGGMPGMQ